MDSEKMRMSTTTNGKPPREGWEDKGAAGPIKENGQHEAYYVLAEEERAKGFVRPVRQSYKHVGLRPKYALRDLTQDEKEALGKFNYVSYEEYPESMSPNVGRYWTSEQLTSGCGSVTKMGLAIAETYARDPKYYGSTFCVGCRKHLPVEEFAWEPDGGVLGE